MRDEKKKQNDTTRTNRNQIKKKKNVPNKKRLCARYLIGITTIIIITTAITISFLSTYLFLRHALKERKNPMKKKKKQRLFSFISIFLIYFLETKKSPHGTWNGNLLSNQVRERNSKIHFMCAYRRTNNKLLPLILSFWKITQFCRLYSVFDQRQCVCVHTLLLIDQICCVYFSFYLIVVDLMMIENLFFKTKKKTQFFCLFIFKDTNQTPCLRANCLVKTNSERCENFTYTFSQKSQINLGLLIAGHCKPEIQSSVYGNSPLPSITDKKNAIPIVIM